MKGPLPHPQLILLLLVSAAVGQLASALQVCHIPESAVTLKAPATLFFRTDAHTLHITMTAPTCGVSTKYSVNMTEVTTDHGALRKGNKHRHWHEMSLINCGKVFVKIGFKLFHLKLKYTNKPNICDLNEIEFSFDRSTALGRGCESNLSLSQELCLSVIYAPSVEVVLGPTPHNRQSGLGSLTFSSLDHKDDFGGLALGPFQTKTDLDKLFSGLNDDNFAFATYSPPPSFEHDNDYSTTVNDYRYINFSGETFTLILVGVLAFIISLWFRVCLRRPRDRVRRLAAVTVIRNIHPTDLMAGADLEDTHQEHLDPPPSYADVVNQLPTSPSMDLPPAYSDIQNELTPPVCSGIKTDSTPTEDTPSRNRNPEEESKEEHSVTELTAVSSLVAEASQASGNSSSALARVLASPRALKSQYAFRPLREEE